MPLTEEIRSYFAGLSSGQAVKIDSTEPYSSWAVRMPGWYGVAVECDDMPVVSLHFTNSALLTEEISIGGVQRKMLVLSSSGEEYRNEFAAVCAQFVFPGENGEERDKLLSNPQAWWNRWRSLLGNTMSDLQAYSTIGELLAYEQLLLAGKNATWTGAKKATHDIETDTGDYEVKSTLSRYGAEITMSSQFQLKSHGKKLNILFFRFEPSLVGECINGIVERLISLGCDRSKIEADLKRIGMEEGSSPRTETYHLLEIRNYSVNNTFPAITEASFVDGKYPDALVRFTYTVTLDGLNYSVGV